MAILRPQSSLQGFVNHCRETAQYRERERDQNRRVDSGFVFPKMSVQTSFYFDAEQ